MFYVDRLVKLKRNFSIVYLLLMKYWTDYFTTNVITSCSPNLQINVKDFLSRICKPSSANIPLSQGNRAATFFKHHFSFLSIIFSLSLTALFLVVQIKLSCGDCDKMTFFLPCTNKSFNLWYSLQDATYTLSQDRIRDKTSQWSNPPSLYLSTVGILWMMVLTVCHRQYYQFNYPNRKQLTKTPTS